MPTEMFFSKKRKNRFQAETWHVMELSCPHECILFLFLKKAPKPVESEASEEG